jgi:Flp pilus assembly protein TadG
MNPLFCNYRKCSRHHRQGAAVVELAVCLPVLLLIGLGSIQAASMLFLRQALVQSAYESAKVAVRTHATNAEATAAAQRVAAGRRISNMQISFSPADISSVPKGQLIRVSVSAPGNDNSLIPFDLFRDRIVSGGAAMVKE